MDDNYTRSRFRCPMCGEVFGCKDTEDALTCSLKELAEHVKECRKKERKDKTRERGQNG